ncbi:MAG: sigma-70 family RNA polymerase sigma factor [Lachnospiraceae bacterium]|nr:sigma-70 family RNA polymerase sigma factor [Lachnospiraceae bacterium]MCD7842361.1 sigma-70 family RNA polymerase sigma factor [Lachnospiraceae bacterium]
MEEFAELAEKAAGHDADAFTALMQSQMQNMYKTARAILANESDIADAISETILTCWEKLDQLSDPAWFRTWMTRILVNKCNDVIRQRKNLCMPGDVPEISAADSGFTNAEWNEALGMLDEKYRLVLMLYYVEGYKTSEISAILEVTESTVRTQLARGREKLAQAVTGKKRKATHEKSPDSIQPVGRDIYRSQQ